MILLLPIGLLLLAALAIYILNRFQPKFGLSWLIAAGTSFIAWVILLFLRLRLPTTIELNTWQLSGLSLGGRFSLLLDYDNWPYKLMLVSITLAVILSDSARTRHDSTPQSWIASLVISAMGMLALLSGTSLMLLMTWMAVDLFELIYLLSLKQNAGISSNIIYAYGFRMASIVMLVIATIRGWQVSDSFDLTMIPQNPGFFFLLAAGLRLGVLPFNVSFLEEPGLRRGAGNVIRLAPVALGLSLLARLPEGLIQPGLANWQPWIMLMLSIAALYSAVRWLLSPDEIEGRSFWIVAWSALATASVLNGEPRASIAWGIALLLPGSLLFLYSPRIQRMNFLQYLGLLGLVGLPFTPVASGWVGLVAGGITIWTFVFILTHTLTVLGYLKFMLQAGGEARTLESWARIVYPLSLIIILQAILTLGFVGWPNVLTAGVWWLGVASNLLVLMAVFVLRYFNLTTPNLKMPTSSRLAQLLNRFLPYLERIFRLEWIYRIVWGIYRLLGNLLKSFSSILESSGGILWTILLLVLLISVLLIRGVN
jgi:hypothetical protein